MASRLLLKAILVSSCLIKTVKPEEESILGDSTTVVGPGAQITVSNEALIDGNFLSYSGVKSSVAEWVISLGSMIKL